MKISEVITTLQTIMAEQGDIPVVNTVSAEDIERIEVITEEFETFVIIY